MKTGVELIVEERQRQINVEGWTPEHDDNHEAEEMIAAAEAYMHPIFWKSEHTIPIQWPWESKWYKPTSKIRDLAKAGALIAAEIDRLNRLNS